MKALRKITEHLNGSYRRRERMLAPGAVREIALALDGEGFGSEQINAYFREWLPHLKNMGRFAQCANVFGARLTSKLLGIEDYLLGFKENEAHLARFIETFSVDADHLSFNG